MDIHPKMLALIESLPISARNSHIFRQNPVTKQPVGRLRNDSVLVELSREEFIHMALLAMYRLMESEFKTFSHNNQAQRLITNDIQGIMGEAALAKSIGKNVLDLVEMQQDVPHSQKGDGDIPGAAGIEVRTTTGLISKVSETHGPSFYSRLILRQHDDVTKRYVLVLGVGTVYEIAGWLPGSDIRRDEWSDQGAEGRRKVWMAPLNALRPIRELLPAKHMVTDRRLAELIAPPKPAFDIELEKLGRPTSVAELWRQAQMAHGAVL